MTPDEAGLPSPECLGCESCRIEMQLRIKRFADGKQCRANLRNSGDKGVKISSASSIFFLAVRDREYKSCGIPDIQRRVVDAS